METLLGIRGRDFVLLAADTSTARSVVVMKEDEAKIHKITDNLLIAAIGESGDTVQFTEFIAKNIALYKMRNGYDLSPKSAAHYTRSNLANALRTRNPYQVNLLVAGFDDGDGAELHYIDYLANALSVKYVGQGYGGMFCESIFDRMYKVDLTQDEAYEILKKCVAEIQKRLVVSLPIFSVTVVDKKGVRNLAPIQMADRKVI